MTRLISAVSVVAVSLALSPSAFAKPIKTVDRFKAGQHRHVSVKETVHTKTGVVDLHTKVTELARNGVKETKTITEKETPAATGGYTFSKTVTGFDGKATKSSGTVSVSGRSSNAASASGHSKSKA